MNIRRSARRWMAGGAALAAFATVLAGASPAAAAPAAIVVENGATQPVFSLAASIQETVYIRSDMDSDGDGQLDKIAAELIRPEETNTGLRVASIVRPSPYYGDTAAARRSGVVDPIAGDPAHFTSWQDEYFVPRGYAVIELEMQGTARSEGCISVGGPEDTLSVKAVVDWLNGRTTATYANGSPATATWSTGNVGMYGVSYDGTLPNAIAETGIAGLKTIVPVAAISSWYDYTRASGIGYAPWGARYMEGFANRRSNARALQLCAAKYTQIGNQEADDTTDYTSFYVPRNFRDQTSQVTASVYLVHGQRDWNVKTTQTGRYWTELAARNVPRKLYLHDGEHVDPFGGDLTGRDSVGRWMDHWLYNINNGIMNEPQATIIRPDGTRTTDAVWPVVNTPTSLYFGPSGSGAAGTLITTPGSGTQTFTDLTTQTEAQMTANPQAASANRLVYLGPTLTASRRLSGIGRVQVTFTSTATSTPLTAMLVHYTNGQPTRIVTRGALDTKNRTSLSTGTPLVPGQQYTATVELEPKDYIFPAGSRIGLIVAANSQEYIDVDFAARQLTVALSGSRAILPLT